MSINFPDSPTIGDIHSVDSINWLCTGLSPTKWEQQQSLLAIKTISDTAPPNPVYGQMWLDTTTNTSYTWDNIEWIAESENPTDLDGGDSSTIYSVADIDLESGDSTTTY